jgi:hypothetical protein
MKSTETFADFYTHFLHLAGQARILEEDLWLDIFNKPTLELQWTILPVYSTLRTNVCLYVFYLAMDVELELLP